MRISEVRDWDMPGYKQAVFEDGTTSLAPASVVSSLLAEQDKRESFSVPESVKRAQAEQAGSMLASNTPSAQPVLFSDPSTARPAANGPSMSDAQPSYAPQMSMERPAQPRPQPVMDGGIQAPGGPQMVPEDDLPAAPTNAELMANMYRGAAIDELRLRGGSSGFKAAQYDQGLTPVRQGMTEQTTGGKYYDPEAQNRIDSLTYAAKQVDAQTDIERSQAAFEWEKANRIDAESEAAAKQAAVQAAEQQHGQKMADLDKQAQDIAQMRPDARRYLDNLGADKKVAFMIAAALTGYATRGQGIAPMIANFNELTQRDIESQWKEIDSKKSLNDNALGRLSQQYGSIQAGKQALELLGQKAFLARARQFAAGVATKDAMSAYQNLESHMLPAILQRQEEMKAAAIGNVSRSVNSQFMADKAATAGGVSTGSRLKAARILAEGNKAEGEALSVDYQRQNGMTPEQAAKQGETQSKDVQEYGKRFDAIASGTSALDKVIAENNIKTNDKGDLIPPGDLAGFGSLGGSAAPAAIVSDKGMANRAALNSIVAAVATKRFGAYNPTQGDSIRDEIVGNGSARTITTNLGVIRRELEAARDNMKASFSPGVHQQYERNKGASRATDDKFKAFKPVEGL